MNLYSPASDLCFKNTFYPVYSSVTFISSFHRLADELQALCIFTQVSIVTGKYRVISCKNKSRSTDKVLIAMSSLNKC